MNTETRNGYKAFIPSGLVLTIKKTDIVKWVTELLKSDEQLTLWRKSGKEHWLKQPSGWVFGFKEDLGLGFLKR